LLRLWKVRGAENVREGHGPTFAPEFGNEEGSFLADGYRVQHGGGSFI
jgi:hypothetical protein